MRLDNYEASVDRIVATILGHRDKPELGTLPAYTTLDVKGIPGLSKVDFLVLREFSRRALDTGDLPVGEREVFGQAIKIGWGANAGNIVYPGDWYNFWGNSLRFEVPPAKPQEYVTYAFKVEIFAVNAAVRSRFYLLGRSPEDEMTIRRVDAAEFDQQVMRGLPPN